jgi:hypothetical protein
MPQYKQLGDDDEIVASTQIPFPAAVQGSISSKPAASAEIENTLDEPVSETLLRDLRNIWNKTKNVLNPIATADKNLLRDWDWWGPLLLCLILSVRLSITAASEQGPQVFSVTFFIIWIGSGVVTLNSKLLGGNISFYQSVCVLGYCIFPLVAVSLITFMLPFFLKFIVIIVAFLWSTFASTNFLQEINLENRKIIAIYPIFLFYFMISWLILLSE